MPSLVTASFEHSFQSHSYPPLPTVNVNLIVDLYWVADRRVPLLTLAFPPFMARVVGGLGVPLFARVSAKWHTPVSPARC